MFPPEAFLQWGTCPQHQWWKGKLAFGSTLQGIVCTGEELGWSQKSFKLGLCPRAFTSTCPGIPWGQCRVVSRSKERSSMGRFRSCCFLKCLFTTVWQHWILDLSSLRSQPEYGFMEVVVGPTLQGPALSWLWGQVAMPGRSHWICPPAPDGVGRYHAWPAPTLAAPQGEATLQMGP